MSLMDSAAKKHIDELLKLPVEDRSAAAEALLLSLEEAADGVTVEQEWTAEIARRIAEDAPGIPAEVVFAEGRARLERGS